MKPLSTLIAALALPIAFAAPALAASGQTLGTVVNGNTTIEFRAADTSDIDLAKLQTWNDFAAEHSNIARELAYKPSLINSDSYLKKHPDILRDVSNTQNPGTHKFLSDIEFQRPCSLRQIRST